MKEKLINYFFDSKEQYEAYKPYITFIKVGLFAVAFVQILISIK